MAWFTTKKGKHINTEWFLKDEQIKKNKEIADRLNAAGGSIKGNKPQAIKGSPASIKVSGNLAKRGISNANDIEKHLRGLSSTRRNRLAKELGIEGRGEEKLKAMVSDLSSAGKPGSTIPGSQAKGIVKKTTAPEYERTPKMDWIDKRIEGKQTEIDKLLKKKERIETFKAPTNKVEGKYEKASGLIFGVAKVTDSYIDIDGYSNKSTEAGMLSDLAKAVEKYDKAEANSIRDMIKFNEITQIHSTREGGPAQYICEWEEVPSASRQVDENGQDSILSGKEGVSIESKPGKYYCHVRIVRPEKSKPINAVGMDVNQLAEEITFKNMDEKLGLKTTDAQKLSLLGVFSAMKDLFHSYDANRTPREIFTFEVNQPLINDELIPDNYVRVFIGVKGKTGNEYMDSLDTDYASVSIGKSGGFFTYNRNRKKVYFKTAMSAVIGLKEDK